MASQFWSRISRDKIPVHLGKKDPGWKKKKKINPNSFLLIVSTLSNNQPAKESLGSYLPKSVHYPLKNVLSLNKPSLCFLDLHVSSLNSFCHKTRTYSLITKEFNSGTTWWRHAYSKVYRKGNRAFKPSILGAQFSPNIHVFTKLKALWTLLGVLWRLHYVGMID